MPSFRCLGHTLWLGVLILFAFHSSNVHSFQTITITSIRPQLIQLHDSSSGDDVTAANNKDDTAKISTQSITTMDDGGSDLTDRFKYKVSDEIKVEPPYGGIICLLCRCGIICL